MDGGCAGKEPEVQGLEEGYAGTTSPELENFGQFVANWLQLYPNQANLKTTRPKLGKVGPS